MSDFFATSKTVACQAPLSVGFPRQEYWSGLLFSPSGDLPDPGIEPAFPILQADSLPLSHLGSSGSYGNSTFNYWSKPHTVYHTSQTFFQFSSAAQLCLTLCGPLDCNPPNSSVHGIFQARILEWVAIFLLQGIFLTQGSNTCLQHWQVDSLPTEPSGKPVGRNR